MEESTIEMITELKKFPPPFNFYRFILKSDHFHFGLWPENCPDLSMEDAQHQMFEFLVSFFPEPPATVLDVGCGLGYSASLLAAKGYRVVAIDTVNEFIEYANKKYGTEGVTFRVAHFLSSTDDEIFREAHYDVVLFQESTQYLSPLDSVFKKARWLLKEKGLLVIGDEVCYDLRIRGETAVHPQKDYIIGFSENGFRIMENIDLTERVIKTCDFIIESFEKRFNEIVSYLVDKEAAERLSFYIRGWKNQKIWYSERKMGYEVFVAKRDKYFIRSYSEGDEEQILPMFREVFRTQRTLEHWYWKFRDNPYGSHRIAVTFSEDGRLVAHYAGYPVPFYFTEGKTREFISYQIGDTMTHPSVRRIGLGKTGILARTANYFYARFCRDIVPLFYGFNTGHIRELGKRYLGYVYIDPIPYWILDLPNKRLRPLTFLQRFLSGFRVAQVEYTDSGWDKFFDRVRDSYVLLVRRDARYVKWRYLDCPDRLHRVFAVYKRGRIVGWAVFSRRQERLIWGDALFDRKHPEAISILLAEVLNYPEFNGVTSIEGWFSMHPSWWSEWLKNLGFILTKEPNNLYPGFRIFSEEITLEILAKYFYFTMGDSDLF